MELITFLLVSLTVILPLYMFFRQTEERKRVEKLINKLPGPKRYPFIGTAKCFIGASREDFYGIFLNRNDTFGPLFRSWSGSIPCCHVMKPEHAEVILSNTENLEKGESYKFVRDWLGEGLITNHGEKWHRHRKLLTPTFHFRILDNFTEVMVEKSKILVQLLRPKANGEFFDLYKLLSHTALDILTKTAMGIETNAMKEDSPYVHAVYAMTEVTVHRIYRPHLHPNFIFKRTAKGRLHAKHLSILHGFTMKVIEEKREKMIAQDLQNKQQPNPSAEDEDMGEKKRLAFLDMLLETNKKNPLLSVEEIREEVDTFMFAGHDTTTVTTFWTLFCISNYPGIQEKVHEELDEVLRNVETITPAHLAKLQYLERVIKESMRMYPIVPVIARTLRSDIVIDGYTIPPPTMVCVHICHLHKDPKQFPDPLRFDPDRFLPEIAATRHHYSFIPFSAGPRNCLGQKFAIRSTKTFLASILKEFSVKALETPDTIKMYAEIVLRPQGGMNLAFRPRKMS